jgi:alkyl hydroperoxide reductase subunit AhpF
MWWRDDRAGDTETKDIRHVFIMAGAVPNSGWLERCVALGDRERRRVARIREAHYGRPSDVHRIL